MDMTNGHVLLVTDMYNKINVCIPIYYASCCFSCVRIRYNRWTCFYCDVVGLN